MDNWSTGLAADEYHKMMEVKNRKEKEAAEFKEIKKEAKKQEREQKKTERHKTDRRKRSASQ